MLIYNYGYIKLTEGFKDSLDYILNEKDARGTFYLLAKTFLFLFVTVFFMYIMRYIIIGNSRKIEYDIRKDLFSKLINLPISFYKKEETGDLVSRIVNDLNDLRTLLGPGIMYIPNALSRIGFFIPVMLSISPKLLIILMIQMIILIVIIFIAMPKLRPFYRRVQDTRAMINNQAWQMIYGITTIKLNTMEKYKKNQFHELNQTYIKHNLSLAKIEEFIWPFFLFFFSLSEVVILLVGGEEIISGEISVAELLQFSLMVGVITFPIFSLGWVTSIIQQGISAHERISKFFSYPIPSVLPYKGRLEKPYSIEFKKVSFKDERGKVILKDINLKIAAGSFVGISGKIGSGKTLFIDMLAKVIEPTSGKILLNKIDIRSIPNEVYYKIVAFVPQETFLFSTSMKNNLAFDKGLEPKIDKVIASAKMSSIHDEINQFKDKYEEIIGERGINLSGGQKQRTAIGRAIYKKADVLVMDDSLSSVDSETEGKIIKNFKKLKSLKTIIFSSHKVSFLKQADKIIFLKNSTISEVGTHSKLLKDKKEYYKLVKLQQLKKNL